jgi:hypothetical protein
LNYKKLKMEQLVVKDNRLIQASYSLGLVEQRLMLLAIVGARETGDGITAESLLTVRAEDYAKHFNVERQAAYMALSDAVETLFNRRATIDIYDKRKDKMRPMVVRLYLESFRMNQLAQIKAFEQRDTALHKTGELYGLLIADLAARIGECSEDSVQYSVLVEQQMQYQTQQRHLPQLNTQQLEQRSQQLAEQVKARYTA